MYWLLVILACLLTIVIAGGVWKVSEYKAQLVQAQAQIQSQVQLAQTQSQKKCTTGKFYAQSEWGYYQIGDVELCGGDLSMSAIMGPSLTEIIKTQEGEIKGLVNDLEKCRSEKSK